MIFLLMAQADIAQQPVNITCFGGGTANKAAVATVNSYGNFSGNVGTTPVYGNSSGSATVVGTRQQGFDDQVDVRLFVATTGSDCRAQSCRPSTAEVMVGLS